jgi:hypothetical protein
MYKVYIFYKKSGACSWLKYQMEEHLKSSSAIKARKSYMTDTVLLRRKSETKNEDCLCVLNLNEWKPKQQ